MKQIFAFVLGLLLLTSALPALAQTDVTVYATAQRFEGGLMLWRSDTAFIWVLADNGRAYGFPPSAYGPLPDNAISAPAGRIRPLNGFGKIWGNRIDLRTTLGWPVQPELGFDMRVITANGVTYLRQLDGTIYQIDPGGVWSYAPGFPSSLPTPSPVPPFNPAITAFDVQPQTVSPGGSLTVNWSITYAPQAIIEVYDVGTNTLVSDYFGVAPYGTLAVPVSSSAASDLRVVLTAVNPQPAPQYGYQRLRSTETIVHVTTTTVAHNVSTYGAFQQFQNGFMLWRSDTGNIDVFYGAFSGAHASYSLGAYGNLPENAGFKPPLGLFMPVNGFGRVWGNYAIVRDGLGLATAGEQGYQMTVGIADDMPVSFSLPDGRVAHATNVGTWSFS